MASDYTFEAWVYYTGWNGYDDLDDGSGNTEEYMYIAQRVDHWAFALMDDGNTNDGVRLAIINYQPSSGVRYYSADNAVPKGEWAHVALVRSSTASGDNLYFYVNGVDKSTGSGTGEGLPAETVTYYLYVGQKAGNNGVFLGYIDELRLRNDAQELISLNVHKSDPEYTSDSYTAALFHFNEGSGSYVTGDISSNIDAILGSSTEGDSQEPTWHVWNYNDSDLSLPVELYYFSGKSIAGSIALSWETASEHENLGYLIQRRSGDSRVVEEVASYITYPALEGAGSTTRNTKYSWLDTKVIPGMRYYYTLTDVDYQGKQTSHKEITVTNIQEDQDLKPTALTLSAIYPNPFNPSTSIRFSVQQQTRLSATIYNAQGRQVAILAEQQLFDVGEQELVWQAEGMPSGIYFITLRSADHTATEKVVKLN
jgi:hypothetical protein